MAFTLANFARVSASANTNAPTIWSYNSGADAALTVEAAGYFLSQYNKLAVGDVIYCKCSDANHILTVATVSATALTTAVLV